MHRLLIVDDEEPILFAMESYFSGLGYEVDCAAELEEAEALLTKFCYGLVVADLRLSGAHGAEALALVTDVRQRCPKTRLIVLTSNGFADVEAEARRLGVDAFVTKPLALSDLAHVVASLLESAA